MKDGDLPRYGTVRTRLDHATPDMANLWRIVARPIGCQMYTLWRGITGDFRGFCRVIPALW